MAVKIPQLDAWKNQILDCIDTDSFAAEGTKMVVESGGLICVVCNLVATSPCFSGLCCCVTVCNDCMIVLAKLKPGEKAPDDWSNTVACPVCRARQGFVWDYTKSKMIRELKVKCLNADCKWTAQRADLDDHQKKCPHAIVRCPNSSTSAADKKRIECDHKCKRGDLRAHTDVCGLRNWVCPDCSRLLTFRSQETHKSKYCPKAKVECPDCGQVGPREGLDKHTRSLCEFWRCPGCKEVLRRDNVEVYLQHLTTSPACTKPALEDYDYIQGLDNKRIRLLEDENMALHLRISELEGTAPPAKRRKIEAESAAASAFAPAPAAAASAAVPAVPNGSSSQPIVVPDGKEDRKEPDRSATKKCPFCSRTLFQKQWPHTERWHWDGHDISSGRCPTFDWVVDSAVPLLAAAVASNGSSSRPIVIPDGKDDGKDDSKEQKTKECPVCHNPLFRKQFTEYGTWQWLHLGDHWDTRIAFCTYRRACSLEETL